MNCLVWKSHFPWDLFKASDEYFVLKILFRYESIKSRQNLESRLIIINYKNKKV